MQAFHDAKQLLDNAQSVLLTMHERMDGDDGGSVLALHRLLSKQGKRVTSAIKGGVPRHLQFLPGSEAILDEAPAEEYDLLITFGCATLDRSGQVVLENLQAPIINFDHHPDNEMFGHVNVVDPEKSSVAELIYDFFVFHRFPIDAEIATCLLTGIITDTGGFMHANTSVSALKASAELMKRGSSVHQIVKHTFKKNNPQTFKAWSRAIENSIFDSQTQILYSLISQADLEELELSSGASFEGVAETLNTVPEAKYVMFLKQEGQKIKGSLRSDKFKGVDVSAIAKLFGGGGHKLAAGFSLAGHLVKDEAGKWRVV
jgi:phosphoesterase RecJ-like protein